MAIGGYFVRPTPMPIESVTAKVPLLGGMATQQRSATRMPFLAFESASVTAFGGVDNEGTARSYAQAVVERLNVLEVVTADRCVATVSSEQRPGEQPTIRIQDARVDGLRVFGRAVEVQFSFPFNEFPTFEDWHRFASNHNLEEWAVREEKPAQDDNQLTWAHLGINLRGAGFSESNVEIEGNVMHLPDFGSIHFGEILIARSYRRISMLRFQLGSPVEGQIEVSSSKGGSLGI